MWYWPIALIFTLLFDITNDVFWPPWCSLMVMVVGYLTFKLIDRAKIPVSVALLFGYVLISALYWSHFRPSTAALEFDQKAAIRYASIEAGFQFLILSGLFYTQWARIRKPMAIGFFWGGFLHSFFLIFDQVMPHLFDLPKELFSTIGLLGNRSIGASFTAVWFFFALHLASDAWSKKWPEGFTAKHRRQMQLASLIALPAIALSVSSISFGALILGAIACVCAVLFVLPLKVPKFRWTVLGISLAILLLGMVIGPIIDPEWYHHVSRYDAWPMFTKFYWDHNLLEWGTGIGTFKFYGPFIQDLNQYMPGKWWIWAHNDWLQLLFELGIYGFSLSVFAYLVIVYSARFTPALFGAGAAYGAVMIGNYPTHIAMFSVFGFWLTFESIWGNLHESPPKG